MTKYRRIISEGIQHIEELPIGEFIDVLQNLPSMVAQEKLDGSQLWLGLDDAGKFFTSREGKRAHSARRYKVDDWPLIAVYNQFRAAQAALELKVDVIKQVLQPGDMIEAEVLFGRQPNSVTYGADGMSFIAFLRGVNDTPDETAKKLSAALLHQTVNVDVQIIDTTDGEALSKTQVSFELQFTAPKSIDSAKLKSVPGVDKLLGQLKAFLSDKSSIKDMTNQDLMLASLTQTPKDIRPEVKLARTEVLAKVQADFKLPIKQALLDTFVHKARSHLTDKNLEAGEDIGIEGIVLRDPKTGEQIKVVDKDIFLAINRFNQSMRGQIQSSLRSVDPDAELEARGGIVGTLRIRIAELLGNRELAKGAYIRKILEPMKGTTPEEAIRNFAASLTSLKDYQAIKKKILAMTTETAQELKAKLDEFKKNQDNYKLKLKNGKEIKLSKDTIKRTLLSFAEGRKNLIDLYAKIKETNSLAQLLAIMYGTAAKAVHAPPVEAQVAEGLLETKTHTHGDIDIQEFAHKDKFHLVNSYLSVMFMAMLIYHTDDRVGMRLLRDRKNHMLKKFSHDMSPVNFWGYVIWSNNMASVKKQLTGTVQHELASATKHIPKMWIQQLHMAFSYDKDKVVDWAEHEKTLQRLIDLTSLRSDRLNTLLDRMIRWPELTYDEKVKAISKLYLLAQQFVPRSTLFNRLRVIQTNLLLNATGLNDKMLESTLLKEVNALSEDGDQPGADVGSTGSQPPATTAANIASINLRVGGPRFTVKRKRNLDIQNMIKFPDTRKTDV